MTGTIKTRRRSASTTAKGATPKAGLKTGATPGPKVASAAAAKVAAKPKASKVAPSPAAEKAALEAVAELTAADLVEPVMAPVKPVAARKKKVVDKVAKPAPVIESPFVAPLAASVEEQAAPAAAIGAEASGAEPIAEPIIVETIVEEAQAAVETAVEAEEGVEQKGMEIMSDVMETTKKYTDEAKERFQSAFVEISEKAKVGVEKSTKAMEELSDIAKGNVEAMVESGKIASKGMESMGQDVAEYSRVTFEKASAAMKSMAAVKSPTEFFQLHSDLLSSSFDAFAKETAKTSEALLKLAGDVVQPLSTRVSVVTEKVRSLAA